MIFSPNQNKFLWYCNIVEKEVLRSCGPPAALSTVIGSHNSTFAVSTDIDFGLQPYSCRNPRKSIRTRTSEVFSEAESSLELLCEHLYTNLVHHR